MLTIEIPDNKEVSKKNKEFLKYFKERLGSVTNLYASMMH